MCILSIYVLVSNVLSHKFSRARSISDLPPCCQTHNWFSVNAEWVNKQITIIASLRYSNSSLYLSISHFWYMPNALFQWHSFQKTCKLLGKRTEGIQVVWGWPLSLWEEGSWPAWVCAGFLLVRQLCRTLLPNSPHQFHDPPIIFCDCNRSQCPSIKTPLTVFFPVEFFKLHFFLKNIFG